MKHLQKRAKSNSLRQTVDSSLKCMFSLTTHLICCRYSLAGDIRLEFEHLTNLNKGIVDIFAIEPIGTERDYCINGRHVEDS